MGCSSNNQRSVWYESVFLPIDAGLETLGHIPVRHSSDKGGIQVYYWIILRDTPWVNHVEWKSIGPLQLVNGSCGPRVVDALAIQVLFSITRREPRINSYFDEDIGNYRINSIWLFRVQLFKRLSLGYATWMYNLQCIVHSIHPIEVFRHQ